MLRLRKEGKEGIASSEAEKKHHKRTRKIFGMGDVRQAPQGPRAIFLIIYCLLRNARQHCPYFSLAVFSGFFMDTEHGKLICIH